MPKLTPRNDEFLNGMSELAKDIYQIIDKIIIDDYDSLGEKIEKRTAANKIEQYLIETAKNQSYDMECKSLLNRPKGCTLNHAFKILGCGKCGTGKSNKCTKL